MKENQEPPPPLEPAEIERPPSRSGSEAKRRRTGNAPDRPNRDISSSSHPSRTETAGGGPPNDGDNGIILQIWGRLGDHDHAFIQTGDRITAVEQSVESAKNDARCIWKKLTLYRMTRKQ